MDRSLYSLLALAMFFLLGQPSARSQETTKTARPEVASAPLYPNSADGLRLLLQHVLAAAKKGDDGTVEADIRDMEIPNYEKWFVNTFGEEKGESWAQPYGNDLRKNEKQLQGLLAGLAQKDGEISTAKVDSYAKPGSLDWGLSHGLKRPAEFYLAEFRTSETPENEAGDFIGYFVFVGGKFRWDSTIQVVKLLPISTSGVQSFRAMPTESVDQSASGTIYVSELSRSMLTVPQDWRTNDVLARAQFGIGAFNSPDSTVSLLIQQMPTTMSPADFAMELDARGDHLIVGYHKIGDSHITLDGKDCEAVAFQFTDTQQTVDSLFAPVPLQSWMVFIPVQRGLIILNFVTSSALFDFEQPTFNKIVTSYHSTAVTQVTP